MDHAPHRRHSFGIIPLRKEGEAFHVLLIRQSRLGVTQWNFPKGTPEEGETPAETALRETKEEVGLSGVQLFTDFAHTESYTFTEADATEVHKQVTYFAGIVSDDQVTPQEAEVEAYEWLPIDVALSRLTYPGSRHALESLEHRLHLSADTLDK